MHVALILTLSAAAQAPIGAAPPPAPTAAPAATAWACTKQTLLDDVPCTIEGTTAAQAASKELAKENQRQARVLADEVCAALARSTEVDADDGLLGVCTARATHAIKRCGGDGSRRLLDDAGRFNPGHARCYGALATMARELSDLRDASSTCCTCVSERCGASAGKCTERMADGKEPDAPASCMTGTGACASACASLQLVKPGAPPSSTSPASPPPLAPSPGPGRTR